MNLTRRRVMTLLEVVIPLIYLFTGPTLYTWAFAWAGQQLAFTAEGHSRLSWLTWLGLAPLLYTAWLIWLLACMCGECHVHRVILSYRKVARASSADGFSSWLKVHASLMMYLRHRFVMSLPLVEAFLPLQFLRDLVLRSYSLSTHLGWNSLILGNLFDPDITVIGDDAIIGTGSSVIAHSMTLNPDGTRLMITSPIKIGARSVIGGAAQIHPGVQIGEDAVVEPASYVSAFTVIGDGEVWGGNPARFLRMRSATQRSIADPHLERGASTLLDWDAETTLRVLVARVLHRPVETVTPHLSALDSSAWDSLAQLGMAVELQKQFGIALTNQESFRLRSMACLREVIAKSRAVRT